MLDGAWERLKAHGGDVDAYARAVAECGEAGHRYQLHATKQRPSKVTCKSCQAVWPVAAGAAPNPQPEVTR